jgi:hypothetical protein
MTVQLSELGFMRFMVRGRVDEWTRERVVKKKLRITVQLSAL